MPQPPAMFMQPPAPGCGTVLQRATEALRRHFGFGSLRDFQAKAIGAWAEGKDVLIALSTGAGKSLCFQLPPTTFPAAGGAVTLVISPLISLMQDQFRTLRQRQLPVSCCGSAGEVMGSLEEAVNAARGGVVYVSPEFAMRRLPQLEKIKHLVCLLAIDEAHCISAWGHDFRPTYQQLGQVRDALGRPPTMALTATCTTEVQRDIRSSLHLKPENTVMVQGSVNRPNLKFVVQPRTSLDEDFTQIFDLNRAADRVVDNTSVNAAASTIVYVPTRARSEEVANWLQRKGLKAAAYHAGLSVHTRHERHQLFMWDRLQVMVATVAFGMGIDKPSVRRVIHYGGVQSLAHFMQQCGRAGRDGEEAECICFHRAQDVQEIRNVILQGTGLSEVQIQRQLELHNEMTAYLADSTRCRRVGLLRHFGEQPKIILPSVPQMKGDCVRIGDGEASCQWCDVCLRMSTSSKCGGQRRSEVDFTTECLTLLDCVFACGGFTGRAVPCSVAAGSNNQAVRSKKLHEHRVFGSGRSKSFDWWKAFLPYVLQRGLLQEKPARLANGRTFAAISLSEAGRSMVQSRCGTFLMCPVPEDLELKVPLANTAAPTEIRSSGIILVPAIEEKVQELYKRLSHVRQQWMRRLKIMGESIISNPLLRALAQQRPSSARAARASVQGLPQLLTAELEELLEALVEEINRSCKELSLTQTSVASSNDTTPEGRKRPLPWENVATPLKAVRSPPDPSRSTLMDSMNDLAFPLRASPEDQRADTKGVQEEAPQDEWLNLLEM